ncbi:MAG: hypothetical protein ABI140_06420 [Jatrophihabitantaceae bacterium]
MNGDDAIGKIASHFPAPPPRIQKTLIDLQAKPPEAEDHQTPEARAQQLADFYKQHRQLPRPWDPPTCEPELRRHVWQWLDKVAAWLNQEYVWQPEQMIPACWPFHPHIAHELAVLACLRWDIGAESTAEGLESWHRFTLPGFLDRMTTRLDTTCRAQEHKPWPALARQRHYATSESEMRRSLLYSRDTGDHASSTASTARVEG